MRLLANENLPGPVVRELRRRGHDVLWVKESMRGARDEDALRRARTEKRLVVTCDKGFGELAFRARMPAESGIVLFRLGGSSPARDNARAVQTLESRGDWSGHFAVVDDDRVRMRPLPAVAAG